MANTFNAAACSCGDNKTSSTHKTFTCVLNNLINMQTNLHVYEPATNQKHDTGLAYFTKHAFDVIMLTLRIIFLKCFNMKYTRFLEFNMAFGINSLTNLMEIYYLNVLSRYLYTKQVRRRKTASIPMLLSNIKRN